MMARKKKRNPKDWTPIGHIGDVDPIAHDGGIIYETPYGYEMLYFEGYDDDKVTIWRVAIDDDVMADVSWADWDQIADYTGQSVAAMRKKSTSKDPTVRASLYQDVASYSGWINLDESPTETTYSAAAKKYGADADAALKSEQNRRQQLNPKSRKPKKNPRVELYDAKNDRVVWSGTLDQFIGDGAVFTPDEVRHLRMLESDPRIKGAYLNGEGLMVLRRANPKNKDAVAFAVAGVDEHVVVMEGIAVRMDNEPNRSRSTNPCKRGEILIDRKRYKRKGYRRADGTRVRPTVVPAASFCIPDPGKKGRRARGAEKGPYRKDAAWIEDTGSLGGPGYTKKNAATRRRLLDKCVRDENYRSCLGKLQVLLRNTELKASTRKTLEADKKWLVKKYGGPGSFGPEKNPHLTPDEARRRIAKRDKEAAWQWLEQVGSWPSDDPEIEKVTKAAERLVGLPNPYQGDAIELAKYRKKREEWEKKGRKGPPPVRPGRETRRAARNPRAKLNQQWVKSKKPLTVEDEYTARKYAKARAKHHGAPQDIYVNRRSFMYIVTPSGSKYDTAQMQYVETVPATNPKKRRGGQFFPEERALLIDALAYELDEGEGMPIAPGQHGEAATLTQMRFLDYDEEGEVVWLTEEGYEKAVALAKKYSPSVTASLRNPRKRRRKGNSRQKRLANRLANP